MHRIKYSLLANFAGKLFPALLNFAFIPLYVKLIGIESYGLIGFFFTLQNLLPILDLGLSSTINRELAKASVQNADPQEPRDLVRALEVVYWTTAALIGLALIALAPVFAAHWIHAQHLSPETVSQALLIMGFSIALQFPFDLYAGGLQGLQRQVLLNTVLVVMSTVRAVGMILILRFVSPTVAAYAVWQTCFACAQTVICAVLLWRSLPPGGRRPRFQPILLRRVARFAAGMSATGILSIILMQTDKVLLSRLLPLAAFGYYMLANTVALSLITLISPIFGAMFPTFSRLAALDDQKTLTAIYHQSCQLMSVLLLPCATVIALFAPEVVFLWTGNPVTVEHTHLLVSLLVIGTALNGLTTLPYALQLAYGWTQLGMWYNLAAAVVVVPAIFVMAHLYGAVGAATVWIALNSVSVLFFVQVMHRRILVGAQWRWYREDVGLPLAATLAMAVLTRWLFPAQLGRFSLLLAIPGVIALTMAAAALAAPLIRSRLLKRIEL